MAQRAIILYLGLFRDKINMNNNDRRLIVRLDERVKSVQTDISEIKESVKSIHGCISDNEVSIVKVDTRLDDHLKNHVFSIQISKKNWAIISGFAALVSAGIAGLSLLIITIIA